MLAVVVITSGTRADLSKIGASKQQAMTPAFSHKACVSSKKTAFVLSEIVTAETAGD